MDSTIIGTFLLIPFLCVCVKVWVYIDLVYASTSLTDFDAVKETEPSLGNYNCYSVFKSRVHVPISIDCSTSSFPRSVPFLFAFNGNGGGGDVVPT